MELDKTARLRTGYLVMLKAIYAAMIDTYTNREDEPLYQAYHHSSDPVISRAGLQSSYVYCEAQTAAPLFPNLLLDLTSIQAANLPQVFSSPSRLFFLSENPTSSPNRPSSTPRSSLPHLLKPHQHQIEPLISTPDPKFKPRPLLSSEPPPKPSLPLRGPLLHFVLHLLAIISVEHHQNISLCHPEITKAASLDSKVLFVPVEEKVLLQKFINFRSDIEESFRGFLLVPYSGFSKGSGLSSSIMRVKKQKRHRKIVRFYMACFGFREPLKILCDGTFIHHLIAHDLTPADDVTSHLLGAKVLLFTTRCVVGELRSLGKEYAKSLQAAQMLMTARCDHENRVSAEKCVESIIGGSNTEHFFVATQDAEIRKMLREIPGVPVIYGLRNSLFLEQPSTHQREFVKSMEEKRLHMSDLECQKLQKIQLKDKLENSTNLPATLEDSGNELITTHGSRKHIARQMLGVTDKSKFKRKKAKGPNPLSCKKKKMKVNSSAEQNPAPQNQDGETGGVAKRKRIRKRKKAHKDNKLEEPSKPSLFEQRRTRGTA